MSDDDDYTLTKDEHLDHHRFLHDVAGELHTFLEDRRRAKERWEKIRDTAIGTIVVGVLGAVGAFLAWIGHLVLVAFQHGSQ